MRRYAQNTFVSTDKSISEISNTVRRYGAFEFTHADCALKGDDKALHTGVHGEVEYGIIQPDRQVVAARGAPVVLLLYRTDGCGLESFHLGLRRLAVKP